ncbi:hypothetical protein [Streptomyces sp. DH10]|uniref:hypothetical protein n=1 Tax=Streptomyces sp. DH10 TaxID=3040121 RepID=UPI0024433C0F|nr:hypothetical protein [Streptomyces sp. DH10]MDG9709063.1 hypothetical protein [Streptomyces sp. DH10]
MSDERTDELTAMIMDWPAAWRQPDLFALSLTATGLTASGAADAVLGGLLAPVTDPAGGVQRLIDSEDFRTARALLERACTELPEEQRAELADRIDRAAAATRSQLQPRVHRLATRARALGLSVDEDYWNLLALDSGKEASSALDEWETELDGAVAARRRHIEKRSGELHPEQLVVALACLDSGEYDLAERVAAQSAYEPGLAGPASVSRPSRWPYGRHSSAHVVKWLLGAAAAPADFSEYRPAPSDEHAWVLLNAVHEAHDALDEASARRLADAFGHLVQDAPTVHRVQSTGDGGFTVELSCLVDSRLPWLTLSWRTTLHIGPEPPRPRPGPCLWLPTSDDRGELPQGVAVVEPHFLFSLLQPGDEGRVHSTQWRRMNVLRHVCAQLPFDRVASLADQDLGDGTGTKAELLWLMDLLGLRAAPEVADMVLYYTAAVPAALEALLGELSSARRPRDLGHEDLSALRNSPEVARVLRRAVFAPLRDDVPAQVVCGALFGRAARHGTDRVSAEQLEAELEDLTMLLMEEYEAERLRPRNLPLERIDADGALTRIENEGLVERSGGDVVLPGTGLVSLIAGEETAADTVKALRRLHENLDQAEELARLLLVSRTERSHQHVKKGHLYALDQLRSRLAKASDPAERGALQAQISAQEELIEDLNAMEKGDVEHAVRTTTFDMLALAESLADAQRAVGQVQTEVVDRTGGESGVTARRLLVQLTLNDLVLNAAQAMDAAQSSRRLVRITVGRRDTATERFLVVDVEDSGPGFGNADRTALDRIRRANRMPGGEGLVHAERNMEACRGRLERLREPSADLGGAHLRLLLPLAA